MVDVDKLVLRDASSTSDKKKSMAATIQLQQAEKVHATNCNNLPQQNNILSSKGLTKHVSRKDFQNCQVFVRNSPAKLLTNSCKSVGFHTFEGWKFTRNFLETSTFGPPQNKDLGIFLSSKTQKIVYFCVMDS